MHLDDLTLLSHQFMMNAVAVQPGDNIWVEFQGEEARPLAQACKSAVEAAGGSAFFLRRGSKDLEEIIARYTDVPSMIEFGQEELRRMQTMQGYIRICDIEDELKFSGSDDARTLYQAHVKKPMTDYRVRNTRWLVVTAPTKAFAEACSMSLDKFEAFYREACLLDYKNMQQAAEPLREMMQIGRDVHILGKETDIRFSIEGIAAKACAGKLNLPDGECFTAPVKNSINGEILFGPSVYSGKRFEWIKLRFENGKVIDAKSHNEQATSALNHILDMDEGSRYVGEFAIAFNPVIEAPVGDILFDEKIAGSLHLALGQCYEDHANNGNGSQNHWDMVHIQRPEHGGGEIWMDGSLIRKDGRFTVSPLEGLNPEKLAPTP